MASATAMVAEIEGPRGAAKAMTGIDFVTDVSDVTAFFQIVPKHDPTFVVTVHGKFVKHHKIKGTFRVKSPTCGDSGSIGYTLKLKTK